MSSNAHENRDEGSLDGKLTSVAGAPVVVNNNVVTAGRARPDAAAGRVVPRETATLRPRGHPRTPDACQGESLHQVTITMSDRGIPRLIGACTALARTP